MQKKSTRSAGKTKHDEKQEERRRQLRRRWSRAAKLPRRFSSDSPDVDAASVVIATTAIEEEKRRKRNERDGELFSNQSILRFLLAFLVEFVERKSEEGSKATLATRKRKKK